MRKLILSAAAVGTLVAPTVAMASVGHEPAKGVTVHVCVSHKKHGLRARIASKCKHGEKELTLHLAGPAGPAGATGPQGPHGIPGLTGVTGATLATGAQGKVGKDGTNGIDGAQGAQGPQGNAGAQGPQGPHGWQGPQGSQGHTGATGPQGTAGTSSPFTWTYTNTTALDSGYGCGTDSAPSYWATDNFSSEYAVSPLGNGSYLVVKYLNGTFTTNAGAPAPNGLDCAVTEQGGQTGSFQGVETWTINPQAGYAAANFDPGAAPAASSDMSNGTSGEAQNREFTQDVFGTNYTGPDNFDFVYHMGSQSWVDSNTSNNNTGNIID
jgi:collagen triple helix repeat protein